ncbi:MAG: restriction endonuclease subunit S, partial [Candidatus Nanohaloarchaea archaeon]
MTEQASLGEISEEEQQKSEETEHYELGKVPEDWNVVRMADRTEIEMGSSPKSEFYNEEGEGLPFFQGNNEFGKKYPEKEVWCSEPVKTAEEGDILISVRAPVGDLNIAREKSCIGRGLAAISNKDFNREYLFYHLQERKKWLQRISAGSTYDSINSSQLKNLKLRLPEKDEQRRIASVLYNVDQ